MLHQLYGEPLKFSFQPFLRFYRDHSRALAAGAGTGMRFQPFLRFYDAWGRLRVGVDIRWWFQPFLRF